jgi:hypothetical protein
MSSPRGPCRRSPTTPLGRNSHLLSTHRYQLTDASCVATVANYRHPTLTRPAPGASSSVPPVRRPLNAPPSRRRSARIRVSAACASNTARTSGAFSTSDQTPQNRCNRATFHAAPKRLRAIASTAAAVRERGAVFLGAPRTPGRSRPFYTQSARPRDGWSFLDSYPSSSYPLLVQT